METKRKIKGNKIYIVNIHFIYIYFAHSDQFVSLTGEGRGVWGEET